MAFAVRHQPGQCDTIRGGCHRSDDGNPGSDGLSGAGPRTIEVWAEFTAANSWTAGQTIIELRRRNGAGDMILRRSAARRVHLAGARSLDDAGCVV